MESLKALENAELSLNDILVQSKSSSSFASKDVDRKVRSLTLAIKKDLRVDYSVTKKFKTNEKEKLEKMFLEYLTGKGDDFNSYYIQLLAWHLIELKIMPSKSGNKISIFEYSPNPLAIYTVIEKTFKLFQKKRIDTEKVSFALILNYLNNYKISSSRYKNKLRRYLKSIRFSDDLDIYLDINKAITYAVNKTMKLVPPMEPYPERLLKLRIRTRTLDTIYFADSWFAWMFNVADLTDEAYVLKNLNCNYFKICNDDMQKLIMAKIIYINGLNLIKRNVLSQICIKYIFPLIKKGNPFKKGFWDLNYSGYYKTYLNSAWNFIEETFVNDKSYKNMVNFEDNYDKRRSL